jgi:hypothetical protein
VSALERCNTINPSPGLSQNRFIIAAGSQIAQSSAVRCRENDRPAIARGKYLHFLDDDDWLAPHALLNFWHLAANSEAGWLYGTTQVVDRQLSPILQLHHGIRGNGFLQTMAGEWIPLQASLIKADLFFELGGFNPLLTGPEDIDLLRRVTQRSDINNTPAIVANVVMGETGSTTDYGTHHYRKPMGAGKATRRQRGFFQAAGWGWHKFLARPFTQDLLDFYSLESATQTYINSLESIAVWSCFNPSCGVEAPDN